MDDNWGPEDFTWEERGIGNVDWNRMQEAQSKAPTSFHPYQPLDKNQFNIILKLRQELGEKPQKKKVARLTRQEASNIIASLRWELEQRDTEANKHSFAQSENRRVQFNVGLERGFCQVGSSVEIETLVGGVLTKVRGRLLGY